LLCISLFRISLRIANRFPLSLPSCRFTTAHQPASKFSMVGPRRQSLLEGLIEFSTQ